ncbi:unnamed protein product [Urochloa humidicola]
MEEQGQREFQLQLLLLPSPAAAARALRDVPTVPPASAPADQPPLDLDLSMSIGPRLPPAPPPPPPPPPGMMLTAAASARQQQQQQKHQHVMAVKQEAAEQARMACAERAYAERVRELARRELELAEREFARARAIWERAREEVERVERMKQIAARRLVVGTAAAAEITCHACMQRFHP